MMLLICHFVCFVCSRPRTVDDVAYQDEVVAVLKKTLEGSDVRFYFIFKVWTPLMIVSFHFNKISCNWAACISQCRVTVQMLLKWNLIFINDNEPLRGFLWHPSTSTTQDGCPGQFTVKLTIHACTHTRTHTHTRPSPPPSMSMDWVWIQLWIWQL